MTIDEFMSKFSKGQPQPTDTADNSPFDFSAYPRLLRVLRVAKAFGADLTATEMSKSQAAELMMGMKTTPSITQQVGAADMDLDDLAELLETEYSSDKASPELSSLSRMASTGAIDDASNGAKGKVIKQLVLHASPKTPGNDAPRRSQKSTAEGEAEGDKDEPRRPPGAPKKRRTTYSAQRDGELLSDNSLSSNSGSDEEEFEIPIRAAKKAKTTQPAAHQSPAEGKNETADASEEAVAAQDISGGEMLMLGEICPPGMKVIEAARVVFAEDAVRKVANCEPIPSFIEPRDEPRMAKRYALAFKRLVAKIGTSWRSRPDKPARHLKMLEDWAEAILDVVAQDISSHSARDHTGSLPGTSHGGLFPTHMAERDLGPTTKPAEGLTGAKQAGAIGPDACQRLYKHKAQHEAALSRAQAKAPGGKVLAADVIGETPATIRSDIQKAAMSNSLIDAPGETVQQRRSLPPFAHGQRRTTAREIEASLKAVALADSTGQVSIDTDAVAAIAATTLEGSVSFADYLKLANTALGTGAAPKGSATANIEAWSFFQPAMLTLLHGVGAPQEEIAALSQIGNVVTSPPGIARLSPVDVVDWISASSARGSQACATFVCMKALSHRSSSASRPIATTSRSSRSRALSKAQAHRRHTLTSRRPDRAMGNNTPKPNHPTGSNPRPKARAQSSLKPSTHAQAHPPPPTVRPNRAEANQAHLALLPACGQNAPTRCPTPSSSRSETQLRQSGRTCASTA